MCLNRIVSSVRKKQQLLSSQDNKYDAKQTDKDCNLFLSYNPGISGPFWESLEGYI